MKATLKGIVALTGRLAIRLGTLWINRCPQAESWLVLAGRVLARWGGAVVARYRSPKGDAWAAERGLLPPATGFHCPLCACDDVDFLPIEPYFFDAARLNGYALGMSFETLNVGQYSCSRCGGTDRDRLYALFMDRQLAEGKRFDNLLEMAPTVSISTYLSRVGCSGHRKADLMAPGHEKVDIQDMHIYREGQFDAFICSHVLEHVPDDLAGMRELRRVLSPTGWGICMVPINTLLDEVLEDPDAPTVAERWRRFGQWDHIRMYSKQGFVERLEKAGCRVEQLGVDYFGKASFVRHGIHADSVLYVVRKS